MNIFLYGPSGSGKSTVGKILAFRLGKPWFDLDMEIEKSIGTSIETYFSAKGEPAFREIEGSTLDRVLRDSPSSVVSLGGGALLNEQNRLKAEKAGRVIVLSGEVETLLARLVADDYIRPLIKTDPRQRLTDLLARRGVHYSSFGEPIMTDNFSPLEIADEVQIRLGRFHISGMGESYDVWIQSGLIDQVGKPIVEHQLHGPSALVCDQHVDPLYADQVIESLRAAGIETSKVVITAGEENKTVQTV